MTSIHTAIITGASQGLGLELAKALAAKGVQHLILNARNAARLNDAAQLLRDIAPDSQITPIAGAIEAPSTHQHILNACITTQVDLLVNNASTLGQTPRPALLDYEINELQRTFQVNVLAPLALLQCLRDRLSKHATIINISSDAGREAYPQWGGYGASKAALDHLSRTLGEEHPDWFVYAIDPGDMNTQMHQDAFPGEDITDRATPASRVPGILRLLQGEHPSGLYSASQFLS